MPHPRLLKTCIATAAAGAALITAVAPADAGPAAAGAPTAAPAPVSAAEFRLVIKDVTILDAAGTSLRTHHCEWTEPQDDDKPCLAFSGDPRQAYDEIRDAGGSAATVTTQVPDLEIDTVTTIRERSNGTWLFRTDGTAEGKPLHRGYVCSADGRTCSPWAASSKRKARRAINAASARTKKRAERRRAR